MLKAKLFAGLPLLLSIAGAIVASVAVRTALRGFRYEGRQLDLDVLILASASLLVSLAGLPSSVSFLRRRLQGKPPKISAFTEKRREPSASTETRGRDAYVAGL